MSLNIEINKNRPTRAEISLAKLKNNYNIVKELVGDKVKIMAMIKANAYGHGMIEIARELITQGVNYLGVAYLEEAIYLRKKGITSPILVLGAINTDQIKDFIINDIEITSSSLDKSKAISEIAVKLGKTARIHLKIDTGMARIGVQWYNSENFIEKTYNLPHINVVGIFSHFAKADCDMEFTNLQLSRFESVIEAIAKKNIKPELIHIANSAGIINLKSSHFNMVRPGLMLYGYDPTIPSKRKVFDGKTLQPIMTLKTKVSYFKVVAGNTGISYNHTYKTDKQTRIVTLPIGYGDGYSRFLSNKGTVIIRNNEYPVVGNICMDQMMVDIGMKGTAYNGDDVLLFGNMENNTISLEKLCQKAGMIPYEFLCLISSRVPRIYLE